MLGNVADFTSFSFHAVKNLTTAEGGAVTWRSDVSEVDDQKLYHEYQLLSLHGQSKDALSKMKLGAWEYDIQGTYYKCNMTDIHAAIGLVQLNRYKSLMERRRKIIEHYNDGVKSLHVQVPKHYGEDFSGSGHLYLLRLLGCVEHQRNKFIEKMAEKGVATNVHYKPLPMHMAYKRLGFDIANYPNAYAQYQNEITLPLHTKLSDEDVEYVLRSFIDVYQDLHK